MTNSLNKIRQGDLYALLEICTKDELDPLVEAILGKLYNFLVIDDDYKKYAPDHTKYHRVIGNEIRSFGGNSIRNLLRGCEGPPYAEIVIDVCKKLDVPCQEGDTIKNERNLLDLFFEGRWESLNPDERERQAENARKSALSKNSNASTVATIVATRFIFGAAGWAVLGKSLLDPAYRVTISCVLQIAYLRRKILEEGREKQARGHVFRFFQKGKEEARSLQEREHTAPSASPMENCSNSLVIRAENGNEVISFTRIPEPSGGRWHEIGESDDGISRLNPLLQVVPSLATVGEVAGTCYMEVVANGMELVRRKNDGILTAMLRGSDGKLAGAAEVIEPSRLSAIVNTSALLNITSLALAQKHLADISKKLTEIKSAVDEISKFQKEERHSILTGSIRYFKQMAPSILEGELEGQVLHQIERHEADLVRVEDHLSMEIRSHIDDFTTLKDDELFGSEKITQVIKDHLKRLGGLYCELCLCIRARAFGWQLLCVFPGGEMGKKSRRQDIQKSLDALQESCDYLKKTDELLLEKIHGISSSWNKKVTINERKLFLLSSVTMFFDNVRVGRDEIQRDLDTADEMLAAMQHPVKMAVRIEGNQMTAVQAL